MAALEDLLQGVPVDQLELQCSDEHLLEISTWLPHWRDMSAHLGLSEADEEQISHNPGGLPRQNIDMLRKWKARFVGKATYKKLAAEFVRIGHQDLVKRLSDLMLTNAPVFNHSTTKVPQVVMKYAAHLSSVYEVKPCGEQWLPIVSNSYTNLCVIESIEDFPKKEELACTIAMIHSKIDVVKKMKRSIHNDQVGLLGDGKRAKCIIVEGIPGIGKSTFSWHLGVCWAKKTILHDYHLVVLLRLRDKRVQRAKEVSDLIYYKEQTKPEQKAVVKWITDHEGDGVMIILDGYDELSLGLQKSSIFADIIKGEVLPKMTVLVSSRPSANKNLHQLCEAQRCQYIEVIGFGKEEIQKYVEEALKHCMELRDQLNSYLENYPHIHGLMYCPLNCAIIVQIFREQMKKRSQPPQTLTEVYQLLIKTVLKRHEQKTVQKPAAKRHKTTEAILTNKPFPWLNEVLDETVSQLLLLAKLAYDGTSKDQLIFHGPSGEMETLGLLQEVPELYLESSGSSSYHFLHKTIQEFMAALYVSSLPSGERAKIVRTFLNEKSMTMVVRFVAGLTKFQSQDDIEGVLTELKKDQDSRLVETLHWLFEAHNPDVVQKCMAQLHWKIELVFVTLDPFDCYVIGYCIANSRQPWDLSLLWCSITEDCVKMLMITEKGRTFDYVKTMKFGGNDELGNQGASVLGRMLRKNKVLTTLDLQYCGLTTKGICDVCSALEANATLTTLDLSMNNIDEQGIASLVQLLISNQTLQNITLSSCSLGDDAICLLVKGLVHCKLTKLDLSKNDFAVRGTKLLSHVLENHPTLTKEMVQLPYGLKWSE